METSENAKYQQGEEMYLANASIRKRKDNRWEIRYYENNKQLSIYGKTQKQAILKYKERDTKQLPKAIITLKEWITTWLNKYKIPYLSENTIKILNNSINKHIIPYFDNTPLTKLSSKNIMEFLEGMKNTPRQQDITYLHLKECLTKAVKEKLLKENPFDNIEYKKHKSKQGTALSRAEQNKLVKYLHKTNHKMKSLILFYLYTGARRNEALDLRQADIDRENNIITIRGTKTSSSFRTIQSNSKVVSLIPTEETPFDFKPDYVSRQIQGIYTELGIKDKTVHSLRHTFATRCLENGIDMKVVQKWLGHSSIKMTADTYSHIHTEYETKMANKVDPYFDP